MGVEELEQGRSLQIRTSSPSLSPSANGDSTPASDRHLHIDARKNQCSLLTLTLSCMIAGGVQFGWALQLSLLTPYIQVYARRFDV